MTFKEFAPLMRRRGSVMAFHLAARGFVYAILCHDGMCKIGSSTNPVARIRDQIGPEGELKNNVLVSSRRHRVTDVFISGEILGFRTVERCLQLSFAAYRRGAERRAEIFKLPSFDQARLVAHFNSNFCEILIADDVKSAQLQEAVA